MFLIIAPFGGDLPPLTKATPQRRYNAHNILLTSASPDFAG